MKLQHRPLIVKVFTFVHSAGSLARARCPKIGRERQAGTADKREQVRLESLTYF